MLKKKTLIVGASGGIGLTLSTRLIDRGDREVTGTYLNNKPKPSSISRGMSWEHLDITKVSDIINFIESNETFDEVIFCSGVAHSRLIGKFDSQEIMDDISINLSGPLIFLNLIIGKFLERGSGTIILISSIVATKTVPGIAAYSAAKAGVINICRSLNRELILRKNQYPHNVKCLVISPGYIKTSMTQSLSEKMINTIKHNSVVGRIMEADELVDIITFLLDFPSDAIAGAEIYLDGGLYI